MEENAPATPRPSRGSWTPSGWSLRSKISVVLVVPAIVALVLGGARIKTELDQASRLSAIRDELPVVQNVAELADLVDQEMVAVASAPPGTTPTSQFNAVDAKVTDVQRAADFAHLPPDAGRTLDTALGRLAGLRTATVGGDPVGTTSRYRDIVYTLVELVPTVVAGAGDSGLDATASTARSLVQLRTTLAVQEALLRSIRPVGANQDMLAAAGQAAAEESVLNGQVRRGLTAGNETRFDSATASAADRRAVFQSALATDRRPELAGLLPPIAAETAGLGDLVTQTFTSLSNTISSQTDQTRSSALRDTALVLGALLGALAIALWMARSVISPMRRLHAAALDAARRRLPDAIERIRSGEPVPARAPLTITTGEEIGQLAYAFDDMERQATRLAGEQAELRRQVSEMFMTLARRSQSMVEQQLTVLDGLESNERDPQRLDELFRLDHLATRLRRNGENLQVLAGGSPARRDTGPVPMVELLRGAASEVKDYQRVSILNVPSGSVRAHAAADIVHILAELLENATRFSPPDEKVYLTADRGSDGGLLVEVVDHGLGMTTEDIDGANHRLAAGDVVTPETARRMGLFVAGRLAALHGVTVRLRPTMTRSGRTGITASVHLPGDLIVADSVEQTLPPRPAVVVPAQPQVHTPIFEGVVSNWFTEHHPDQAAEFAPPARNWLTPADDVRRAAEAAVRAPAPAAVSDAGLPTRRPGAQLAPGAAVPRQQAPTKPATGFRDPSAVRNNLSKHYNGMRAARQRTANEEKS